MLLEELIKGLDIVEVRGSTDVDILGISYDSRTVKPGDVFVAIPGFKVDALKFAAQAVKSGAAALISQAPVKDVVIPQIIVPSARTALAKVSCAFYDNPSRKLKVIGVTGTNGKTTICYLLEHILRSADHKVGLIGTVEMKIDGEAQDSKMTTPESLDLQKLFDRMLKSGITHVVMEVSSHSLALDRVAGTEFDVAVFTNLTHDHLDFHGTMDGYLKSKLKLFHSLGSGVKKEAIAVVNADDPYSKQIMGASRGKALTYGMNSKADLKAKNARYDINGMSFEVYQDDAVLRTTSKMIGIPNVYNILASVLCALSFGENIGQALKAVSAFKGAPGRYERIECGQPFPVVVDFAHSPDSLQKLVETYRPLVKGKIILLFGCPGDRDREKRPIMGGIATKHADHVIISTDDPHSEDPEIIMAEIEKGVVPGRKYEKIADRNYAIQKALGIATKDDIVLLAGRGHEKFQDFGGKKVAIDDRDVVKEFFKRKAAIFGMARSF
jgi:UDP-N-acetylmuramoyl-L-alanyl-D-glutamate--2,6-diaminopimelate ligase